MKISFKKTRAIMYVLCALMMINGNSIAHAKETVYVDNEQITFQINELYNKYNMGYEFISYEGTKQYTLEEVNIELSKLEDTLKNISIVEYSYVNMFDNNEITPNVMEITKNYTTYGYADNGITGGAQIELTCTAKINLGSNSFMSISNISTRQYGSATNFISWTHKSSSYSYEEMGRHARVEAEGTLVTELTILGVKHRTTNDHIIGMVIAA